jgi:hypothetical protein
LADQNLDDAIVWGVIRRQPNAEFHRLRDLALERATDEEVLAFASRERYIVVSHDLNTMTTAASRRIESGQRMHGLFLVQQDEAIGPTIDSLILIWESSEAERWHNAVEFLPF